MVQISLIVLSITGIIVINLLNKDKPVFKLGGTAVIIIGCVLAMLYYYNIKMFTDTATIVITIALSVSLLLLTYVILVLALSYKKSKMDVRKKDISKRSTFKKSDKKEKRRKLQPGLNSDLSEPDGDSDLIMTKKDKQMPENNMSSEGAMKTVGDYLNQIGNEYVDENNYVEEKISKNIPVTQMNDYDEDLNAQETEDAEEWTPSLVSDDEIEAYMKEQYAWMEENKPENELSMSLIFGGDDNAQFEEIKETYHPEILEKSEEVKDIKVKASENRARKLTGEPHEIEIEIEELTEYPEEPAISIESAKAAEEIPQVQTAEETPERRRSRKRRLRQGRDEAEALQDWVNAKSAESERRKQIETEEYAEDAYISEEREPEVISEISYAEESIRENADSYAEEAIPVENISINEEYSAENEEYSAEKSEEEPVQPFDFTQTLEQAIARGEQSSPEKISPQYYEAEYLSEIKDEFDEEPADIPIEPVFADMLSEDEDDVLSIEEAEQYAQNFFVNNISEPESPSLEEVLTEQLEEEIIEPVVVEEELTMPEKKEAELAELTQLVMQKNYPEAMKKVFAILNAGYVMTPDEKQKMRLVMLTLKAKT